MRPEEIDALHPEELWLIVILEACAQINLKKICGLPAALVAEVWAKWSTPERPPELRDNPEAVADVVLFNEVRRLAALRAGLDGRVANAVHVARAAWA